MSGLSDTGDSDGVPTVSSFPGSVAGSAATKPETLAKTCFESHYVPLHEGSYEGLASLRDYTPGTIRINNLGVWKLRERAGTRGLRLPVNSMESADIQERQDMTHDNDTGYGGENSTMRSRTNAITEDGGNLPYAFVMDASEQKSCQTLPLRHRRVVKTFTLANLDDKFSELISVLHEGDTPLLAADDLASKTATAFALKASQDQEETLKYLHKEQGSLQADSLLSTEVILGSLYRLEGGNVLERLATLLRKKRPQKPAPDDASALSADTTGAAAEVVGEFKPDSQAHDVELVLDSPENERRAAPAQADLTLVPAHPEEEQTKTPDEDRATTTAKLPEKNGGKPRQDRGEGDTALLRQTPLTQEEGPSKKQKDGGATNLFEGVENPAYQPSSGSESDDERYQSCDEEDPSFVSPDKNRHHIPGGFGSE